MLKREKRMVSDYSRLAVAEAIRANRSNVLVMFERRLFLILS
jgi:hypothetical protein